MLGLSSRQKEGYSKEIREIIMASGGVMRVHPMTLEEIKTILSSVEMATSPDPGTDIAEAWINHKLSITKLAKIRLSLQSLLEGLGVQLFPVWGSDECKRKANAYAGKKVVEELAAERSNKSGAYSQDKFREIHDVFMDDYIKERRRDMGGSEDIVFVTSNRELISFTKHAHPDQCYMISTGRVVLELWMHNVKPSDISSCVLTETMARCLERHNIRVRNKIAEVSRFYNENKGNFDPQVYRDFIKRLYQRARNVILAVEENPDNLDLQGDQMGQRILDAVKADQDYYDKMSAESDLKNTALAEELESAIQENEALSKTTRAQETSIASLMTENEELTRQVHCAHKDLVQQEKLIQDEKNAKEIAEEKVRLFSTRDNLMQELSTVEDELTPLEKAREGSFKDWHPKVMRSIGIILIIFVIIIVIWVLRTKNYPILPIAAIAAPLGIYCLTCANRLNDAEPGRKEKAMKEWEQKEENKRFLPLKKRQGEILAELTRINERLG